MRRGRRRPEVRELLSENSHERVLRRDLRLRRAGLQFQRPKLLVKLTITNIIKLELR